MRNCDGPQGSVDVASKAQPRASSVDGGMANDCGWRSRCKREGAPIINCDMTRFIFEWRKSVRVVR